MARWRLLLPIGGSVLLLDQISKNWILANLELYESLPVLPPFVQITRSYNTGVAFGIGESLGNWYVLLIIPICLGVLYLFVNAPANATRQHIGLSLVLGGAVGNLIDRIQHGVVIDFVHLILPNVISNVSNFADHAIVIGALLLLVDSVLQERALRQAKQAAIPQGTIQDNEA
jgi:signal peptidase II